MDDAKSLMILIKWIILIGLTLAIAITIPPIINLMMARAQNITLPQNTNDTKLIVSMKNHTLTFVNRTTNETIKVENFTLGNATTNETLTTNKGNATTNETLTTNTGNTTTNENLTPENTTIDETLTTNTGNTTTNENLTAKFNDLQGK
jgi:hypothetical protein